MGSLEPLRGGSPDLHVCRPDSRALRVEGNTGSGGGEEEGIRAVRCGMGVWEGQGVGLKMKRARGWVTNDLHNPAQWSSCFCPHQRHQGACQIHVSQTPPTELRASQLRVGSGIHTEKALQVILQMLQLNIRTRC